MLKLWLPSTPADRLDPEHESDSGVVSSIARRWLRGRARFAQWRRRAHENRSIRIAADIEASKSLWP